MTTFRAIALTAVFAACSMTAGAQERPFLYTLTPSGEASAPVVLNYGAAYGRGTFDPLGGDRLEQTAGVQAALTRSVTVYGRFGLALDRSETSTSQHVELLMRLTDSADRMVDFSAGPGYRREYGGTDVLLARAILGRTFPKWQLYGNFLFEKPLASDRDKIDLFMTTGWSYSLTSSVRLGIEAVGQDLEGFWEENEAEGGAVLFVGPTLSLDIPLTPWTYTIGGGPIVRATKSSRSNNAPRDIKGDSYVVHSVISFGMGR